MGFEGEDSSIEPVDLCFAEEVVTKGDFTAGRRGVLFLAGVESTGSGTCFRVV